MAMVAMVNVSVTWAQNTAITTGGEVIYHVFQRSFNYSNGDLQGDLNGRRQKLDIFLAHFLNKIIVRIEPAKKIISWISKERSIKKKA